MLAAALEAEVDQYTAELEAEQGEWGRRMVVRNGHHRERTVKSLEGTGGAFQGLFLCRRHGWPNRCGNGCGVGGMPAVAAGVDPSSLGAAAPRAAAR